MNISAAISELSGSQLTGVEYVRLVRMGYTEDEIEGATSATYESIMAAYNERNAQWAGKSGKVNIWKVPVQPRQVNYLRRLGYEVSQEDLRKLSDAKAREFITVLNFAIENQRFIEAYPLWLKSSKAKYRKFTDADVLAVQNQLQTHLRNAAKADSSAALERALPDLKSTDSRSATSDVALTSKQIRPRFLGTCEAVRRAWPGDTFAVGRDAADVRMFPSQDHRNVLAKCNSIYGGKNCSCSRG